jgi:hypothetical protein
MSFLRCHYRWPWIRSCLLALVLVPAFTLQVFAGFIAAPAYDTGNSANSVAVGDFNGDGIPDLAVVGGGDILGATVSILLGNGDGTFQAPPSSPAGNPPGSHGDLFVAVGDFNGDGHLDLAIASISGDEEIPGGLPGYVGVLLGNGDGSFQVAPNYATGRGSQALTVGDFNGDGHVDLAVANNGDGTVSLLLGNGDGTFQAPQNFPTGGNPYSVAEGDFNGDGRLDLVVGNSDGSVSVLLGNGDGSFQTARTYGVGGSPQAVAVGDFNGDGVPDLAIASWDGGVGILLGKGDGTFQTTFSYPMAATSLTIGDFNGDGRPDLAVAGSILTILFGNGDGTFHSEQRYDGVDLGAPALVAADFNGDGYLDLAIPYSVGVVGILLGNGDATLRAARSYPTSSPTLSIAFGDFNGDGHLDLAAANLSDAVSVMLGNADGSFQDAQNFPTGGNPYSVAVGDFNGDRILDLAVANWGTEPGSVSILLGIGDGSFQTAQLYPVESRLVSVAVGDFNGDGHTDLAVGGYNHATQQGTVSILLGNGDGTFQMAQSYEVNYGANGGSTVAVADYNSDGHLDLAVATYAGVSIFLGNGDGTFKAPRSYAAGINPGSMAVGDFNRDGYVDLAVVNDSEGDSSVTVLLGNGDGSFQAPKRYGTWGAIAVAVGDFNKDGHLDLAVAGPASPVSILLGNGDGTFQGAQGYLAGSGWSLAVGDFNGDGFPDLAVPNGDGVVVLLNATDW